MTDNILPKDEFEALLEKYPNGLPVGFKAVLVLGDAVATAPVPTPTPEPTPTPTPTPTPVVTERKVSFLLETDANPTLTACWDIPDVNSINKYQLFNKQTLTESVPSADNRTMPKEADKIAREAHLRRTLADWAWLPRQIAINAGGRQFSFPDKNGLNGRDLSDPAKFEGMWIKRSSLSTATPPEWIEALVAKVKSEW